MILTPALRKAALTAHVICSVGWVGAVAVFLALAVAGLTRPEVEVVRAAALAMDLTTRLVIVPLSFGSLVTGLISSLGTTWGLVRHYWVVVKLLINLLCSIILLVHLGPIAELASRAAAEIAPSHADVGLRTQMVVASGAALVALLVATVLSVYKPRGLTRYGWRRQREQRRTASTGDVAS